MWIASAERAVDPWAEIRRSRGAAAGRLGAENGQNFRCAISDRIICSVPLPVVGAGPGTPWNTQEELEVTP